MQQTGGGTDFKWGGRAPLATALDICILVIHEVRVREVKQVGWVRIPVVSYRVLLPSHNACGQSSLILGTNR